MRISPLAVAYRHAPSTVLRLAVAEAIRSSHVHPEAVDGALCQATAVRFALLWPADASAFDATAMLNQCIDACDTDAMRDRLTKVGT
jgi:poly(ADP-ribose) glycohydrolase ARH3